MNVLKIAARPATARPALQSPVTTNVYVKLTPVKSTRHVMILATVRHCVSINLFKPVPLAILRDYITSVLCIIWINEFEITVGDVYESVLLRDI
jgi:hypothetical protein